MKVHISLLLLQITGKNDSVQPKLQCSMSKVFITSRFGISPDSLPQFDLPYSDFHLRPRNKPYEQSSLCIVRRLATERAPRRTFVNRILPARLKGDLVYDQNWLFWVLFALCLPASGPLTPVFVATSRHPQTLKSASFNFCQIGPFCPSPGRETPLKQGETRSCQIGPCLPPPHQGILH